MLRFDFRQREKMRKMRKLFKIVFDIYFEQTNRGKTCRGLDCKNSLLMMFAEEQKKAEKSKTRFDDKKRDICSFVRLFVRRFGDDSDNRIIRSREPDKRPPLLNCFSNEAKSEWLSIKKHVFVSITKYQNLRTNYFGKEFSFCSW